MVSRYRGKLPTAAALFYFFPAFADNVANFNFANNNNGANNQNSIQICENDEA